MNRTGDLYMNRIALAVKSALGLALLVPPALTFAAAAADDQRTRRNRRHRHPQIRRKHRIEAKRESTEIVEVVTAEDIGKMPDKNVADSLSRLPGITTSSAGANEGGFDENDRVSMRGTNPSLTQTLINGHNVAAGDWFVLDQTGTVGRSVSYTLLPSEIVSQVVVQKSSSASLVEGGVAGSVDIITRKPLDFSKPFTLEASAGAVYADLPSKTDGQYSALGAWKNDADNFGVMVQLFSETRHLRRDGIEVLGYDTIAPGSTGRIAGPESLRRAVPDRYRRCLLHAGARTQRRHARCGVQAGRQPHLRSVGIFLENDRQQCQRQLPAVVDTLRGFRRRPGAESGLRGAEQYPDLRQLRAGGRHGLRGLRSDLAAGRRGDGEFRQSRHHLECHRLA